MAKEQTTISTISDSDFDIFEINENRSDITPVDNAKVNFTRTTLDETDLNMAPNTPDDEPAGEVILDNKTPGGDSSFEISDLDKIDENVDDKSDKDSELAVLEDLVKKEKLFLFEGEGYDNKLLKDYSKKERTELLEANMDRIREETEAKAPAEFFDSLSPYLQMAFKYESDGGTDLKEFYANLVDLQDVTKLDINDEKSQEEIIRQYLKMQGDHTTAEIEQELSEIKDTPGALEKKAGMYKPKVEAKQKQIIDKKLKDQEALNAKREADMKNYSKAVYDTIAKGDINGIKLTKNTQGMLYEGLTKSVDGFRSFFRTIPGVKTDYAHMAEIYWLATDPKGYAEAKSAAKVADVAAATLKTLKTASQNKTISNTQELEHNAGVKTNTIKKKPNLFART